MKNFIQKLSISIVFVAFSYLVACLKPDFIEKTISFFKLGFHVTLSTGQLDNFEMIPVFTVWTILGIFAYLLYLSLSNVYYEIYNSIILKLSYKEPDQKIEVPKILILKRMGIHLLVIVSFLLIILVIAGMMPVSNNIREVIEKAILPFFPPDYAFGLSFLPAITIWYLVIAGATLAYSKAKDLLFGVKIEEEHLATP